MQDLGEFGVDVRTQGSVTGKYVTQHLGFMGDVFVAQCS